MFKLLATLVALSSTFVLGQTVPFKDGESLPAGFQVVYRVLDADTLTVVVNGVERSVRLIGIDSVERGQTYFAESKQFATDLLTGQAVYIAPGIEPVDRFGRALVHVALAGRDVALLVAQAGWAELYTWPPNDAFADLYKAAVAGAKASRKGQWVDSPNSWRKWRCSSFVTQAEAQAFYLAAAIPDKPDRFGLDKNKNGKACEKLSRIDTPLR